MTEVRDDVFDALRLNQSSLSGELRHLRNALEGREPEPAEGEHSERLDSLCTAFGLSSFECKILLLCAGVELDSTIANLCAQPTFGVALSVFPDAHWSALSPDGPLRKWRLVELAPGTAITTSPLRIDERILHFITGVDCLDERLAIYTQHLPALTLLTPSHQQLADRLALFLGDASEQGSSPVIHLCGPLAPEKCAIAARVARLLGVAVYAIPAPMLPASAAELDTLVRLLEREAALTGTILYLDWELQDAHEPARAETVAQIVRRYRGVLILASPDRHPGIGRMIHALDVSKPEISEQQQYWREVLGHDAPRFEDAVREVLPQFSLNAAAITAAAAEALANPLENPRTALWEACRRQLRPRMESTAQRIRSSVGWDDLVLPPVQLATLHEIVAQVRNRLLVYDEWKFGAREERGLGISALFAGPSGTGKTLAAEVLANALHLDLFRIDLSQLISKYIGETEKNLRRVFTAAEDGGAVLLFDEADAVFGKRSEVRDSHDRYANLEVSYLLQRMESYRGLAILTTNMKSAIDTAFHRRLRFIVQFQFPDVAQRLEIWQKSFPASAPVEGLCFDQLARLNLAGGNIRNAAISAAFLAADSGEPIRMSHLARACRSELSKADRPVNESEFRGWS